MEQIFNRKLLLNRKANIAKPTFMREILSERLADRLRDMAREFPISAEIGAEDDLLAQQALATGKVGKLYQFSEISSASCNAIINAELLPLLPESLDLIMSCGILHNINDLAGFIIQSAMSLRPDGLFLANFIAGDSLKELREVLAIAESEITGGLSVHISPMVEIRAAGMLLQRAGLVLPVVDSEEIKLSYDNIFALMKDIKAMGENLSLHKRAKKLMRKDIFLRAAELYQEKHGDEEGRIIATIEIITMSAWKPSANQQKPLARGSAKNKLQDFL